MKIGFLLLANGETAEGRAQLVDRQHPHDLFMELSAACSHPIEDRASAFVYVGMPREPALGPATYMHRFSGHTTAEAPVGHHWFDSTHVTFGVATAGPLQHRVVDVGKLGIGGYHSIPVGQLSVDCGGLVGGYALP